MSNNVYANQADALEMQRLGNRCSLCGGGGEPEAHRCRCYAYCMVDGCNATFADDDRLRLHQQTTHGARP